MPNQSDVLYSAGDSLRGRNGLYVIERDLGSGNFARVYLAQVAGSDDSVVIKVSDPERAKAEVESLDRLRLSNHVPRTVDEIKRLPAGMSAVVETCAKGVMLADRENRQPALTERDRLEIAKQFGELLQYCQQREVANQDIKPRYQIFWDDSTRQITVIDWNTARTGADADRLRADFLDYCHCLVDILVPQSRVGTAYAHYLDWDWSSTEADAAIQVPSYGTWRVLANSGVGGGYPIYENWNDLLSDIRAQIAYWESDGVPELHTNIGYDVEDYAGWLREVAHAHIGIQKGCSLPVWQTLVGDCIPARTEQARQNALTMSRMNFQAAVAWINLWRAMGPSDSRAWVAAQLCTLDRLSGQAANGGSARGLIVETVRASDWPRQALSLLAIYESRLRDVLGERADRVLRTVRAECEVQQVLSELDKLDLVPEQKRKYLHERLSATLQHHPHVRAACAELHAAEQRREQLHSAQGELERVLNPKYGAADWLVRAGTAFDSLAHVLGDADSRVAEYRQLIEARRKREESELAYHRRLVAALTSTDLEYVQATLMLSAQAPPDSAALASLIGQLSDRLQLLKVAYDCLDRVGGHPSSRVESQVSSLFDRCQHHAARSEYLGQAEILKGTVVWAELKAGLDEEALLLEAESRATFSEMLRNREFQRAETFLGKLDQWCWLMQFTATAKGELKSQTTKWREIQRARQEQDWIKLRTLCEESDPYSTTYIDALRLEAEVHIRDQNILADFVDRLEAAEQGDFTPAALSDFLEQLEDAKLNETAKLQVRVRARDLVRRHLRAKIQRAQQTRDFQQVASCYEDYCHVFQETADEQGYIGQVTAWLAQERSRSEIEEGLHALDTGLRSLQTYPELLEDPVLVDRLLRSSLSVTKALESAETAELRRRERIRVDLGVLLALVKADAQVGERLEGVAASIYDAVDSRRAMADTRALKLRSAVRHLARALNTDPDLSEAVAAITNQSAALLERSALWRRHQRLENRRFRLVLGVIILQILLCLALLVLSMTALSKLNRLDDATLVPAPTVVSPLATASGDAEHRSSQSSRP